MTLYPFVEGNVSDLKCIDEEAPCTLEQTSMCAIKVAQDADKGSTFPGQSAFVPWLICMDSNKDDITKCNANASIDGDAITKCMSDNKALIEEYLKAAEGIHATPTIKVNGKEVDNGPWDPTLQEVKDAICTSEPTLKACAGWVPPTPSPPPGPPIPYKAVCCHGNPLSVDCPHCKHKGTEPYLECFVEILEGKAAWCPGYPTTTTTTIGDHDWDKGVVV